MRLMELGPEDLAASTPFRDVARAVYREAEAWSPRSEDVIAERAEDALAGRVALRAVVAESDGRGVARAVALIETGEGIAQADHGAIGLFECLPDHRDAGAAALRWCAGWLRAQGVRRILAPRTDALRAGLLTAGFDAPQTVFTPYNPPFYADLLTGVGFAPAATMASYRFRASQAPRIRVPTGLRVRVRGAHREDWESEIASIHGFQEEVFAGRTGRVPRGAGATAVLAGRISAAVDPELVLLAEDAGGSTVGVLLCLPDLWQERPLGESPSRARLLSIGVRPGWRGMGVALAMGATLEERLLAKGYEELEASWIRLDNGAPRRLARLLGGVRTRTAVTYVAEVAPEKDPSP